MSRIWDIFDILTFLANIGKNPPEPIAF